MDALKVGVSVQAALSRVADVRAVADKGIADPTKAKERASLEEALSLRTIVGNNIGLRKLAGTKIRHSAIL